MSRRPTANTGAALDDRPMPIGLSLANTRMTTRMARAWRVGRFQPPGAEQDGKWLLALLEEEGDILGVFVHSRPARSPSLRECEANLSLDFLPGQRAAIRFDALVRASAAQFSVGDAQRSWVITGRARYLALAKALSPGSRLPLAAKRRLRRENIAFLNRWAKRMGF